MTQRCYLFIRMDLSDTPDWNDVEANHVPCRDGCAKCFGQVTRNSQKGATAMESSVAGKFTRTGPNILRRPKALHLTQNYWRLHGLCLRFAFTMRRLGGVLSSMQSQWTKERNQLSVVTEGASMRAIKPQRHVWQKRSRLFDKQTRTCLEKISTFSRTIYLLKASLSKLSIWSMSRLDHPCLGHCSKPRFMKLKPWWKQV